jgi:hypothetical protein
LPALCLAVSPHRIGARAFQPVGNERLRPAGGFQLCRADEMRQIAGLGDRQRRPFGRAGLDLDVVEAFIDEGG